VVALVDDSNAVRQFGKNLPSIKSPLLLKHPLSLSRSELLPGEYGAEQERYDVFQSLCGHHLSPQRLQTASLLQPTAPDRKRTRVVLLQRPQ